MSVSTLSEGGPLESPGLSQKSTLLTVLEDFKPVLLSSVLTNATKRGTKELPCRGPPIAQAQGSPYA